MFGIYDLLICPKIPQDAPRFAEIAQDIPRISKSPKIPQDAPKISQGSQNLLRWTKMPQNAPSHNEHNIYKAAGLVPSAHRNFARTHIPSTVILIMCIRRIVSLYYTFLCCLRGCEDSDEECDDGTFFEGEIPIGARIEAMTVVTYVHKDNSIAITHTVVETTHIDPQADCGSGQDMETRSSIPDDASDASTLVENPETASFQSDERIIIEEDTDIASPCPTFVDKCTGLRMVDVLFTTSICLYPIPIPLDDCELITREFSEPDSDETEIEALFCYNDRKICASVPFGYVKARAELDAAVAD
ncbi:hypothetical protein AFCA_012200 [Aspergillus flavus]|nr:hypothetical protein AFCA_012200 [Aspergillus flavus]